MDNAVPMSADEHQGSHLLSVIKRFRPLIENACSDFDEEFDWKAMDSEKSVPSGLAASNGT